MRERHTFQTVEEARVHVRRIVGPVSVDAPSDGAFRWAVDAAALGAVRLVFNEVSAGVAFAAAELGDVYCFSIPLEGTLDGAIDHRASRVSPDDAVLLLSPGVAARGVARGAVRTFTMVFERAAVDAHFAKLAQLSPNRPLRFVTELAPGDVRAQSLFRLGRAVFEECAEPEGAAASPMVLAAMHDLLLTTLLTTIPHDHSRALAAGPSIAPGYMRRAEAWMEAHAGESIGITDIAAAGGVSVRALQEAFRRHRGVSPLQALKAFRLDMARRRLGDPRPDESVARAAAAVGYHHVGRFGAEYLARFGERPSETLRQARHGARFTPAPPRAGLS